MSSEEPSDLSSTPEPPAAGLLLVSTPIGNLGDLSPRALAALREARAVVCEDSRVTGALLARFGVSVPLVPLHDHNEAKEVPRLLARLKAGEALALVSDAGTPLLSDPGFRLVRAAVEAGVPVSAIPGPSAGLMALTLSGLPPVPHLFLGFLPPKPAARRAALAQVAAAERAGLRATLLLFEAPHRVAATLADLAATLGDRPAALARELTKRFEEVRRGTLSALAAGCRDDPPRGEIVLVVGPAPEEAAAGPEAVDALLVAALSRGESVKDAAEAVAAATGVKRRDVYGRALALAARPRQPGESDA
ncbi:MAG: 16S rRNA (cytidine(1402)-2'-O)-methyltransferase [Acetobacteraceae bacterium]|nr:16S rRNA (cytidine(1402)-2'-O)-methyltransferase [Acetobacteraceae bacterium]MDW8397484.1 16S rRNA (cytidine(1402)-2'-O)-methyltransferase [Acetobacteraceae bacterium]